MSKESITLAYEVSGDVGTWGSKNVESATLVNKEEALQKIEKSDVLKRAKAIKVQSIIDLLAA